MRSKQMTSLTLSSPRKLAALSPAGPGWLNQKTFVKSKVERDLRVLERCKPAFPNNANKLSG